MEKENKKDNNRSWIILTAFILFIYQAIYFLNLEGSQLAIPLFRFRGGEGGAQPNGGAPPCRTGRPPPALFGKIKINRKIQIYSNISIKKFFIFKKKDFI